jgi:hypothetical protein
MIILMAIDEHPIDAFERQSDAGSRSTSPVTTMIGQALCAMPLPWPVNKAADQILGLLERDRLERTALLLDVIKTEIKSLDLRLRRIQEDLEPASLEARWREWLELVYDGAKKAAETRSMDRIERIGRILSGALVANPTQQADMVEELMRVATVLSDEDVRVLGAAIDGDAALAAKVFPSRDFHGRIILGLLCANSSP